MLVRRKTHWLPRLLCALPSWSHPFAVEACRVEFDTWTYVKIFWRL